MSFIPFPKHLNCHLYHIKFTYICLIYLYEYLAISIYNLFTVLRKSAAVLGGSDGNQLPVTWCFVVRLCASISGQYQA